MWGVDTLACPYPDDLHTFASMNMPLTDWPYPRWVAHRGAGKLAPENTLAAFKRGQSHGFRMFECDVKLSADGQLFLLHDADLARTTSGRGLARDLSWDALATLDAGSWFSAAYTGEPLLRLEDLATWLQTHHLMVNLEIKPNPGQEAETGHAVAQAVSQLWAGQQVQPLLSSFQVPALQAAQAVAPDLPRALLLEAPRATWLDEAHSLECVAVVPHHAMLDAAVIAQAHAAGLKVLTYTVNAPERAAALWEAGLDGLITDRVDLFEFEAREERLSGSA